MIREVVKEMLKGLRRSRQAKDQQQQQHPLLLEEEREHRVEKKCVCMLLSTIIVDKDNSRPPDKQKNFWTRAGRVQEPRMAGQTTR